MQAAVEALYKSTAIEADAIANAVLYAVSQPDHVDVSDPVIRPAMET